MWYYHLGLETAGAEVAEGQKARDVLYWREIGLWKSV